MHSQTFYLTFIVTSFGVFSRIVLNPAEVFKVAQKFTQKMYKYIFDRIFKKKRKVDVFK